MPDFQDFEANVLTLEDTRKNQFNSRIATFLNSSALFSFYLTPQTTVALLSKTFRVAVLPIAIILNFLSAGLAWKQHNEMSEIEKDDIGKSLNNKISLGNAIVETLLALGTTIGIFAALATATASAVFAPVIVIASLAIKSLFDIGAGITQLFYAKGMLKAQTDRYPNQSFVEVLSRRDELTQSATSNIVNGLVAAAIAISFGVISATGLASFAYISLGASIIGAISTALHKKDQTKVAVVKIDAATSVTDSYSSTNTIYGGLKCNNNVVYGHSYDQGEILKHKLSGVTKTGYASDPKVSVSTQPSLRR